MMKISRTYWQPIILLIGWGVLYSNLNTISNWLIDRVFEMKQGTQQTESIRFFIFELPKVILLLTLIIFVVGILRTWFSPERTRKLLEGKSTITANILASLLGVITPFCSCSAIPLFIGFVESGIPLGVTLSFLIAAPMVNEVAVILLFGLFGIKVMLIYMFTGLSIAITGGWIIGKLKLERWVQDWVYKRQLVNVYQEEEQLMFADRIQMGYNSVKEIVGKVWIFVALGIAVGAGVHGYIPKDFMASFMGKSVWYSVPLAVIIGVPLYSNAAGIIPIVSALIEKGASLGTSLAFMMAVIGLSLPEMIILQKVLKLPLILTFIAVITLGIIFVGYLFNALF